MDSAPGTEIVVALQHWQHTPRDSTCAFYAYQKMSDGTYRPVVTCNDARLQAVGEGDADDKANNKMTYRIDWKPDIDFMVQGDLTPLSSDTIPLAGGGSSFILSEDHIARIKAYMEALIHKSPNMDVLVIGSGPNGDTMSLMEAIECQSRSPLAMYTYTDVSTELVEQARDKFCEWIAPIDFKKIDISQDPIPQGLTAHGFDLIVTSMLSFTATGRGIALEHIKKLMRPGGRLVLLEPTAVTASGSGRTDEPHISISQWDTCLKDHGFSGLDLAFSQGDNDLSALMMTRLLSSATGNTTGSTQQIAEKKLEANVLLGHSGSADQIALAQVLSQALKQRGVNCTVEKLHTLREQAPVTIVIDSVEHPLLLSPCPETFQQIKELLLRGGDVLWLSFQASDASGNKAAFKKMAGGMARVLRRENPGLRLITVDVQDPMKPSADQVQSFVHLVTDVTMLSFWSPEGTASMENEYAIRDGKLLIPRVLPDDHLSTHIDSRVNPQHNMSSDAPLLPCSYLDQNRPIKFDIRVPGLLKTIRFVENDDMSNPLGPDEVQIEARAYGVNFKDVLIALGQMPPATQMTGEIAGVITAVGSNVSSHKIGDRVTSLFVTQLGNQVRVKSSNVVTIPDSISFTDAASIPLIFVAAWYCLHQVARIEKGQRILIHAGSGGVGQAAIQLAQLVGAEIFTTVGSATKKKLLQE
jgi:SAM-dependent methyltransferase